MEREEKLVHKNFSEHQGCQVYSFPEWQKGIGLFLNGSNTLSYYKFNLITEILKDNTTNLTRTPPFKLRAQTESITFVLNEDRVFYSNNLDLLTICL